MYGMSENWEKAAEYCQIAVNLGVEGAFDFLKSCKNAKNAYNNTNALGEALECLGFGASARFGKALAEKDQAGIISNGANLIKSIFSIFSGE